MKRIALLGLAIAAIGLTACSPRSEVTSHMTVTVNGQTQGWTYTCDYNESFCNPNSLRNARTMPMGEGMYYTCDLSGNAYMSRESYRAMTNLEPMKGATCTFAVSVKE